MVPLYLWVPMYGFVKEKYEKCKQDILSMTKVIRQTRLNNWTKDEIKAESQQDNVSNYIYITS